MTDQGNIGILLFPALLHVFQNGMNIGTTEHVNHSIENSLFEFQLEKERWDMS